MCQPALTFCYRGDWAQSHKSRVQCTLLHKQGINQALNVDLRHISNVMDIFIWQWQILCFWNTADCLMNVNICMVAPADWKTWMITRWYNKIFRVKFIKMSLNTQGIWDNWLISPQVFLWRMKECFIYYWGVNTGFSGEKSVWKWKLMNSVSEQNPSLFTDLTLFFTTNVSPFSFFPSFLFALMHHWVFPRRDHGALILQWMLLTESWSHIFLESLNTYLHNTHGKHLTATATSASCLMSNTNFWWKKPYPL